MNPKISIITPIYNAAAYLETAYNSIKKQTLDDVEWIVIDDGSIDGSFESITRMSQPDNRIVVLSQEHAGAGAARNLGIKKAAGEYVSFLDIDDEYYDSDALERMYVAGKKNDASIVAGLRVIESVDGIKEDSLFRSLSIDDAGTWVSFIEYQEDYHFHNYIFRRQMILDNKLMFPMYKRYQDPVFCLKALDCAKRVLVVPTDLYKYSYGLQNPNLVTEHIADVLSGIRDNLQLSLDKGYKELFDKLVFRVNTLFFPNIMLNYSVDTIKRLLEINDICLEAKCDIPILPLTHVSYNAGVFERQKLFEDLLERFKFLTEKENYIEKYLLEKGTDKILIYGAGNLGRKLIQSLADSQIKIMGIIDGKAEGNIEGYKVYRPEQIEEMDFEAIILTPIQYGDMVKKVQTLGISKVIVLSELIGKLSEDEYPDKPGLVL